VEKIRISPRILGSEKAEGKIVNFTMRRKGHINEAKKLTKSQGNPKKRNYLPNAAKTTGLKVWGGMIPNYIKV